MTGYTLVSNAIPLYKSKQFVDIILANIAAIDYPNVEILISDRHQYDDAIDILEDRLHSDPRVIILRGTDALTYAKHYNFLLNAAQGKYFRWMPHDDSYPECALKQKVEILETNPNVVLVNGPWHKLDAADKVIALHHPQKSKLGLWSYETSLGIAFGNYEAHAFKGLFRREVVVEKNILLFDTKRIISPERCWEFAMSLVGDFYNYRDFAYFKRYPVGSTHRSWRIHWTPIDLLFNWYYKFRYQVMLDPKPMRLIAFFLLMVPMTFRLILTDKLPQPWKGWWKAFPGAFMKRVIRKILSRI